MAMARLRDCRRPLRVDYGPSFIPNADVRRNVCCPKSISLRSARSGNSIVGICRPKAVVYVVFQSGSFRTDRCESRFLSAAYERCAPEKRKTRKPTRAEMSEPLNTPSFAWICRSSEENASPPINRLIVKPIPQSTAIP